MNSINYKMPGILHAAVLAVSFALFSSSGTAVARDVVPLDQGWRFHLGDFPGFEDNDFAAAASASSPAHPGYDDRDWRLVEVPHDYVIEGAFTNENLSHGGLPLNVGWYRRVLEFPASAAGKIAWLEFDGVFRDSQYWFDGRLVGVHTSGYIGTQFDLGAAPAGKSLTLAVRVDPRHSEGGWYEGGGIYRHARLVIADPVHVPTWGVVVRSTVPNPGDGVHAPAVLRVSAKIDNQSSVAATLTVLQEVVDNQGGMVAKSEGTQNLSAGGATNEQEISVSDARLWSCDHPVLYTLRTTVRRGNEVVDQVTNTFGIRDIRFDPDHGFFLNGQHVFIQGVCYHPDHAGVGVAVPDRLIAWRLEQLRKIGVNGIRCSHNANAPEFLDACDRLGIVVLDEFRQFDLSRLPKSKGGALLDPLDPHAAQVLRDRNHPSVILWSLANELSVQNDPETGRTGEALKAMINQLDGTRPVTAALIIHAKNRHANGPDSKNPAFSKDGLAGVVDVIGFNYSPDVWDKVHAQYPGKPAVVTEITRMVNTRGVYDRQRFDDGKDYGDFALGLANQYGTNAERGWNDVVNHSNWLAGCFVWVGLDFKGEPKPVAWPPIGAQKGLLDSCGFWKDSTWYYKAWWNKEPSIHVFPHWNWAGREGQEIPVWVYANADEVELFLNGQSLGKKRMMPNSHLEWRVKYQPGTLEARGYWNGKTISDKVVTTGAPARVILEPDRTTLAANGADLSVITVKVVDSAGRIVPTSTNLVRFTVTGAGSNIGVGNGDPACHEPDKADRRSSFWGLSELLVQAGRVPGDITVLAESAGLAPATATLTAR